jgi:glycosyltransferase involved in cell wall biosynthesis
MKIAHVTSGLCRGSAGLGVAVAAISAATETASNEVRVFGLSSEDWVNGDRTSWSGAPATAFKTETWSGPLGYASEMFPALMDFDADIVHLHGLWTYPAIAALKWHQRTKRPLIVSAHGMLTPVALEYSRMRKKIARLLFQDRVLRAASILHSTSPDESASYRELGFRNRIELIPLGMDVLPLPNVGCNQPRRRLLFLGRLHHKKGIDWLIEAWMRLEEDFPDWELSIVGPVEQNYDREIDRLKSVASGKRVFFEGALYGDEKQRHVAGSSLFVMPSRSENFGLTAAEALMLEVPVIATKGTPWSGLIDEDSGWWIEQGATALEQAMRSAMRMSDDELRRRGRNGRRWIERDFSWPVIGQKWQCLFDELKLRNVTET